MSKTDEPNNDATRSGEAARCASHYADRLWSDLTSDVERSEFIACGRAWETGIISRAIQVDVARAFREAAMFRASMEKTLDEN